MNKVSVITATYQKFDKILSTINSVLNQSYDEIEYIICDDGSDAFPSTEIKRFIDNNNHKNFDILILKNETNVGTVKNLNKAYKRASGEFIINLSCGDVFFDKWVVEKIVKRFIETGANCISTSRILYKNNFEPICFLPHYEEREIVEKYNTAEKQHKAIITHQFYDMVSGSVMNIRKKTFLEFGGYDESYILLEDLPFFTNYTKKEKVYFAFDIISTWYEDGGVSRSKNGMKGTRLYEDLNIYISKDKMEKASILSKTEKKLVEYRNKRIVTEKSKVIFLYLRYFPQLLYYLKYSNRRKTMKRRDELYINKALDGYDKEYLICK